MILTEVISAKREYRQPSGVTSPNLLCLQWNKVNFLLFPEIK